jgi:ComF family protein
MMAAHGLIAALSLLGREAGRMVLPSPCVVCGDELPWRARTASCCRRCWDALPRIEKPKCTVCAAVWDTTEGGAKYVCGRCIDARPKFEWLDAWGHYSGGLEDILQAFKFRRHQFLAGPLAELLAETLGGRNDEAFDGIVPIPMHRRKARQRGFNQAELLAAELARRTKHPLRTALVKKAEERQPQSSLARDERAANVRGSFVASSRVHGQSILLVDDICTTGETMNACATELLRKGARRVCAVVVARA